MATTWSTTSPQRRPRRRAPAIAAWSAALRACGLGQVLDIVPNHMAVADRANRWWWDVLENGPSSRYAKLLRHRLGRPGAEAGGHGAGPGARRPLRPGRSKPARSASNATGGSFVVRYYDHELPLSPRTFDDILGPPAAGRVRRAGANSRRRSVAAARPPHRPGGGHGAARPEGGRSRAASLELCDGPGRRRGCRRRDRSRQRRSRTGSTLSCSGRTTAWRIWRTASEELDYRRFFNIETLVGLRIEDEQVFADTHRLILELVARRSGRRPARRPRRRLARPARLPGPAAPGGRRTRTSSSRRSWPRDEELPADWPVAGHHRLRLPRRVNNLFVDPANEAGDDGLLHSVHRMRRLPTRTSSTRRKQQIMREELAAEVDRLTGSSWRYLRAYRRHRDRTRREVREALTECWPPSRCTGRTSQPGRPSRDADRQHVYVARLGPRLAGPTSTPSCSPSSASWSCSSTPVRPRRSSPAVRLSSRPGHGQRRGGHRLLPLQPADLAQRGRRRPGVVRRRHRGNSTLIPQRCRAVAGGDAHPLDPRHQAQRRRPGPAQRAVGDAPTSGRAVRRGAASQRPHRRGGWPDRDTEYLLLPDARRGLADRRRAPGGLHGKAAREAKVHTSWIDPDRRIRGRSAASSSRASLDDVVLRGDLESFLGRPTVVARGRRQLLARPLAPHLPRACPTCTRAPSCGT